VNRDAYFENDRSEMLPFVPGGVRRVLDVGCGAGAFAGRLMGRDPAASPAIWGIEKDPAAAARAAAALERVLVGDAMEILPGLPDAYFDAVILNDILEHLPEPGALLGGLARTLVPGAVLVASIPNVRYFFNVMDLACRGRWDYADEGILDRTHLRFFTRSSMARLFEEAGFRVEDITGINPTGSRKFKLANFLALGRWSDMRYLQFACVARFPGAVP